MDKSFALASLMASLASFADATQCSSSPVEWTNAVNVIGSPGTLTKSAGGNSDWNAGAISTRYRSTCASQRKKMYGSCCSAAATGWGSFLRKASRFP